MEGLFAVLKVSREEDYTSVRFRRSDSHTKKLRRKKKRCFLIQGQQKVVQKKKCDHGITCSP